MTKMIEIPAAQLLGAVDTKTLAEALIARVSAPQAPRFEDATAIPMIGQPWPGQGGIYAGMVRGRDGEPDYHMIVHADDRDDIQWQPAMDWAAKLEADGHRDFALPWRNEQAVLFGNVPELFQKAYYWSRAQHAEYSDYAWFQSFNFGGQGYYPKGYELRARAVRRLTI